MDHAEGDSSSDADGVQLGQRGNTCEGRKTGTGGSCEGCEYHSFTGAF